MLAFRALVASSVLLSAVPARCEEAPEVTFRAPWWGPETAVLYIGFYGLRGPEAWDNGFFGLELRGGAFWWDLHLMSGALSASDGSAYFYAGMMADIPFGRVVHGILSFAPGIYSGGTDHNLGFPLIFRSTAEVSFAVTAAARLGLSFSHMSNGKLAHSNPGVETLSLTLTLFALPY